MDKIFDIDGIKLSIPMKIFEEACKVYVLEDENNLTYSDTIEECKRGNYIHLRNAVVASFTPTLDDLGKITIEDIRKNFSDNEISNKTLTIILQDIKINGGNSNL